jgi:lysozyme
MTISQKGLDLIKHFEQLHDGDLKEIGLQPKMCPAGIWTVGYGRALRNGKGVFLKGEADKAEAFRQYPNLTEAQAEKMLFEDTLDYGNRINSLKLDLKQHQFDALVSFAYNVGFNALKQSTLLKRIKVNASDINIQAAFGMWVKANGSVMLGLVRRRRAEAELFNYDRLKFKFN